MGSKMEQIKIYQSFILTKSEWLPFPWIDTLHNEHVGIKFALLDFSCVLWLS